MRSRSPERVSRCATSRTGTIPADRSTACSVRSSQGRPGAREPLRTAAWAASGTTLVSATISWTAARTPEAPSDSANTSHTSVTCHPRGGGTGEPVLAVGPRCAGHGVSSSPGGRRTPASAAPDRSADGDDGRAGGDALVGLLPGQPQGLLDEGLDDLGLGAGLDALALDEDLALAVAGGHAEVGLAGLARAVDDAAHDGHPQGDLEPVEPGGDLVGQRVDVDLGAPAGRAADDLQAALAQVQR